MTLAGYMAKRVQSPVGFHADRVLNVYSVSSHVNDDFADYINYWKHNGYWLFDSPEIIQAVAQANHIQLEGTSLFYYEVYEMEFDGTNWLSYQPEPSFPTNVLAPGDKTLEGFDVVTFFARSSPECSPLSCNGMAAEIRTNAPTNIACWSRLKRLTRKSVPGPSTKPNPGHTASSPSILSHGEQITVDAVSQLHSKSPTGSISTRRIPWGPTTLPRHQVPTAVNIRNV